MAPTLRLLPLAVILVGLLAPPLHAQTQADTLRIGIMADQPPAALDSLFQQMRSEIVAVAGATTTIVMDTTRVWVNGYDPEAAETIYREMIDGDTDVILAFGAVGAEVIAGRESYPKPTILFGGVNQDLLGAPGPEATSGIENFTYVAVAESVEDDLRTFAELVRFERLAIVALPGPTAYLDIDAQLGPLLAEAGATAFVIPYTTVDAVADRLADADAVYLLETISIPPSEIAALAQLFIDRALPSFTGGERADVELGILATNQPVGGLDSFFRRLALLVETVANGEDLGSQPVYLASNRTLTVNFNTAELVGLPLRYSLVGATEFIGDYENVLAEKRYDLRGLLVEALGANLGIASVRAGADIADQDARFARADYLPSISADLTQTALDPDVAAQAQGLNPQYTTNGVLGMTQILFAPAVNANIAVQRALAAAERERLRAEEWDVILEAADLYFNTLILKANLEIQNRNLELTRSNLRIAELSFEAGQTGRGDILRLRSEAAQAQQSFVESVNALGQAHYALNALLNQPISREIDVVDVTIEQGVFSDADFERVRAILDDPTTREPFGDWLVEQSLTNAPELAILDRNVDAVDRSIRLDGLERFLPTVSAGLDLTRTLNQSGQGAPPSDFVVDQFYSLGIQASIPLFDSNQRRIRRRTSEIQRRQLDIDRAALEQSLEQSVRSVVLDLTNGIAAINLTGISEEAAAEALELAQASYGSGAITVVQLLDAQTNYISARLARASARYDFLATAIVLQRLTGYFFLLQTDEENARFIARFQSYLSTRTESNR